MNIEETIENYEISLANKKSSISKLSVKEKCMELFKHPYKTIKDDCQRLKLCCISDSFNYFKNQADFYSAMASYLAPHSSYITTASTESKYRRWVNKSNQAVKKLSRIMKKHPL